MLSALYTIIIYPLYQIVEFVYRVFNAVFKNTGISILGVSIVITLLCLPLYDVAEKWQEVERDIQKKMAATISRIKKTFKSDEQFMILQAYYRENHYHPLYTLRSSFGLLIQIPFFIAAYQFLSHNPDLQNKSFLFIKNMGSPDCLFKIGSFGVNILPILMTAINICAGAIYTKGFSLRDKIQIYGMALIFLVLLYNSPAGLVFYWTMNNVFSLVKNIFYKLKDPLKKFYILCATIFSLAVIYLLIKEFDRVTILVLLDIALLALPFAVKVAKRAFGQMFHSLMNEKRVSTSLFWQSSLSLGFLCGIVIPSFLVVSSTAEYCYLEGYSNPLYFLYNSFLQSFGLFVFWPVCLYYLFNKKIKSVISFAFFALFVLGIINAFCFQGNYGVILPEVVFSEHKSFFPSKLEFLANVSALIAAFVVITLLFYKRFYKVLSSLASIFLATVILTSGFNVAKVGIFFKNYEKPAPQLTDTDKIITLSKTGKNVIVIMMDRSTGFVIDPVFENKRELYEQFDGFVKYPNTVSFGFWTIQGASCLYGGYEYTPWQMNHKPNQPMAEKHNESLALQANIFSQNGYVCTVLDPPYPNYDKPPVSKAFDDLPNTKFHQCIGKYSNIWYHEHNFPIIPIRSNLIKRNFIWFSIFKIAPMIMRPVIHYEEFWGAPKGSGGQDISHFIDNYSVLEFLPRLTNFTNEEKCFVIMDNEITHDWVFTKTPDFTPSLNLENNQKGGWFDKKIFHVNSAGYIMLGKWFEYLKNNGVWDNTRIIIVADHGANERVKEIFDESSLPRSIESYNPVLMMKDFNAKGKMTDDFSYMTHSDVPYMAMEGLIENPVNPYTGNKIEKLSTEEKNKHSIISFSGANSVNNTVNNGYRIKDTDWYTVHDNIFKDENWKQEKPEYVNLFSSATSEK